MSRGVVQLQFADGRMIVTVVQEGDAAVVRPGDRRFEKVMDHDEKLRQRKEAQAVLWSIEPARSNLSGRGCLPTPDDAGRGANKNGQQVARQIKGGPDEPE